MDRRQHWEQVYVRSDERQTSWHQPRPSTSLAFIEGASLGPGARILDVGGGTSRLVDHLLALGYRPGVLDVSGAALRIARERLGDRAAAVEWFESDVTDFVSPHRWDVWHDRAVFHFLVDAEDRERYVGVLKRAVRPGGHAVIATFGPAGPERCSGLPTRRYDAEALGAALGEGFSLEASEIEDHVKPDGGTQQFLFCRFAYSGPIGAA